MTNDNTSVADLLGPWIDPKLDSSLIGRCQNAWNKPLRDLTNKELATFLQQRLAVEQIIPIAKKRLQNGVNDDTEWFEEELEMAVNNAHPTTSPNEK